MGSGPHISEALEAARARLAGLAARQHEAARAAALGASARDCAALLRMPMERASALMARPAFRELVSHYQRAA